MKELAPHGYRALRQYKYKHEHEHEDIALNWTEQFGQVVHD